MKKAAFRIFAGIALLAASFGLTSCDDDPWYDDWGGNYYPPNGWNDTFYDSRLNGYWELIQYNSYPVHPDDANWFYFHGNGRGQYFYLQNGDEYTQRMRYWCQYSNTGTSRYQINIQYEDGSAETTNYWFPDNNTLMMQWMTAGGRTETYVYDRVGYAPW